MFEDDEPNLKQPTADVVRLWADEIHRAYRDVALFADVPRLEQDVARLPTIDAADLLPIDMLAAGSAATWLALAHYAISGRLP